MSARKTVDLTTSLRPHPAFFSFPSMFERTTWVWAFTPAGTAPVRGSEPTWPATKTRGPATTTPEYGGPPGAGGSIRSIMVAAATSSRGINSLAIRRQDLFEFSVSRSESFGRRLMTNARKRQSLPGPEFRIKVAFRVPMDYAFAWCTDYTPDDGRLEGEKYERRIIERSARRVVFEDLEDTKEGWLWNRDVVTLRPPNRWHMDGIASRADVTADYVLSKLPNGRTQLDLRWRRRPRMSGLKQPTKAQREASTLVAWKRFGAAMERDYRRGRGPRSHRKR